MGWLIALCIIASATALFVDESCFQIAKGKLKQPSFNKLYFYGSQNGIQRKLLGMDGNELVFRVLWISLHPIYQCLGCWKWYPVTQGRHGWGQSP